MHEEIGPANDVQACACGTRPVYDVMCIAGNASNTHNIINRNGPRSGPGPGETHTSQVLHEESQHLVCCDQQRDWLAASNDCEQNDERKE